MKRRREESGFAMLLVLLLSACIAITLYMEIPRVAFEAERQKELLLVDRGNQFKRAIQVFVTDKTNNPTHRYPASIDEMESFNNHRYLRHRYVDPMTGKDEWRLVHINGGILTDSVTTQATTGNAAGQSGGSTIPATEYLSQQASMDNGAGGPAAGGVTRALNRRPSDSAGSDPNNPGGSPGMEGGSNSAGGLPPTTPGMPGGNNPGMPPGIPGMPGQPGALGSPAGGQQQQAPANCFIGDCTTTTAGGQPPAGGIPGGVPGAPGGMGGPGMGIPGGQGNGQANAQSAAAAMIGNLLTTPRPGGMPTGMPGATVGGGVAGVASKYQAEGIMVINQRTKINEWEYIFDQTKYRAPPNPVSGTVGTPQPPMGQGSNNNTSPGTTPSTGSSPGGTGIGSGGLTGHQ
jgi:hypothetical protein